MARSRGIDSSRGIAPMSAVAGSLVAFARVPGKTAKDGALNERNGVFTYHLLQHISKPNEDIFNLMRDVTNGVAIETGETQLPYMTSALRKRDIYLASPRTPEQDPKINFPKKISTNVPHISLNPTWTQHGVTVVGDRGQGNQLNQLSKPYGLYIDKDRTIYIADSENHRIVEWKCGAASGQVVAGGNGQGNRTDQLNFPRDVAIDKKTGSLIICDCDNRRVMRWPRQDGTNGEIVISNIDCSRLAIDDQGFLYVSDWIKNEVRRYGMGEKIGTVVAGGNGKGDRLDQFNIPTYVFVDQDQSVYVSDSLNHRVMKWMKNAREGIVVAGGRGQGNGLTQFFYPCGLVVDQMGTVYVADWWNYRVMHWCNGVTQGNIIVGGNGQGEGENQLDLSEGLSFDQDGNLYVVNCGNHRVQKF